MLSDQSEPAVAIRTDVATVVLLKGGRIGELLSPSRRRAFINHVRDLVEISERRVCRALGQH